MHGLSLVFRVLVMVAFQANADVLIGNFYMHQGETPDIIITSRVGGAGSPAMKLIYGTLASQSWESSWVDGSKVTFIARANIRGNNKIVAQNTITYKDGTRAVFIVGPEVLPSTAGGYVSVGGFETPAVLFLQEQGSSATNPGYVVNVAPVDDFANVKGQKPARFQFQGPNPATATAEFQSYAVANSGWDGITAYGFNLEGTPTTVCTQFDVRAATQYKYFTAVAYGEPKGARLVSWPPIEPKEMEGCMVVAGGDEGEVEPSSGSGAAIIGAIVGVVLVAVLAFGAYFIARRLKNRAENDAQLDRQASAEQSEQQPLKDIETTV